MISHVFPRISTDVLFAATEDGGAAYDRVTETLHHLSVAGAAVLASCDGTTPIAGTVDTWATAAALDPAELRVTVDAHLAALTELGLVGRTTLAEGPPVRVGSTRTDHGNHHGVTHGVLDHGITFCSDDTAVIERIDTYLGTGDPGRETDIRFDLDVHDDGRVVLHTDDEWDFPTADQLIRQICSVVNEYASRTRTMTALHAAGLRTPDGDVVLVSGPPGAGKTTLAAGLVVTGWDYLGDESVGVRPATLGAVGYPKPLSLSAASRHALGLDDTGEWPETAPEAIRPDVARCHGDAGPIRHIVFVRYDPTLAPSTVTIEPVTGAAVLDALCAAALNLGGISGEDFQALCDLADTVPVVRLTHSAVTTAVPALVGRIGT